MIKLYGISLALPLGLIFQSVLDDGVFPDGRKKSNPVPCHKKKSKKFNQKLSINQPYSNF